MDDHSHIQDLIKAVQGWYRFILRSKETLSGEEKRLYEAILKLNMHAGSIKPVDNLPPSEKQIKEPEYDELPTTPIPGPLQFELIQKSKRK